MKYLLFLNKFDLNKDKLKDKIKSLDNSASFQDEESALLIDSKLDAEIFMRFQEISRIVTIFNEWKDFGFRSLKENCLRLCRSKDIKHYVIETKFYNKIPMSNTSLYKHINPYLKHEGILVDEKGGILYLEFKKVDNKLKFRLGFSNQNLFNRINTIKIDMKKFIVVIENPTLVSEVGDFLRLCWIFKLPLYVISDNKDFDKLLNKAKKETKGIDYDKFELKLVKNLPLGYTYAGFSKHSDKNEKDMKKVLLSDKKIALVFGDDKYGLSQELRDKLNYSFRLTPELKKPLRASQALSYVLGFYTSLKVCT